MIWVGKNVEHTPSKVQSHAVAFDRFCHADGAIVAEMLLMIDGTAKNNPAPLALWRGGYFGFDRSSEPNATARKKRIKKCKQGHGHVCRPSDAALSNLGSGLRHDTSSRCMPRSGMLPICITAKEYRRIPAAISMSPSLPNTKGDDPFFCVPGETTVEAVHSGRGLDMKKVLAVTALALSLMPLSARAQERVGDAALGALSESVALEPIGVTLRESGKENCKAVGADSSGVAATATRALTAPSRPGKSIPAPVASRRSLAPKQIAAATPTPEGTGGSQGAVQPATLLVPLAVSRPLDEQQ
jgi:hypothetical protein